MTHGLAGLGDDVADGPLSVELSGGDVPFDAVGFDDVGVPPVVSGAAVRACAVEDVGGEPL